MKIVSVEKLESISDILNMKFSTPPVPEQHVRQLLVFLRNLVYHRSALLSIFQNYFSENNHMLILFTTLQQGLVLYCL
jgi:hypothetical protein